MKPVHLLLAPTVAANTLAGGRLRPVQGRAMRIVAPPLILSLLLVVVGLPLTANAATMEGVIAEMSSGNMFGSLVLSRNDGEDRYSFQFRTAELHVEGVHWTNLGNFHKSSTSDYLAEISCPRKTPCRIRVGKTHVRITYTMRDGKRFATNVVPLDPE